METTSTFFYICSHTSQLQDRHYKLLAPR